MRKKLEGQLALNHLRESEKKNNTKMISNDRPNSQHDWMNFYVPSSSWYDINLMVIKLDKAHSQLQIKMT